jgi:hypothetical protein
VREDAAREREALHRPEHRLVREVEGDLWPVPLDRRVDVRGNRDAVVLSPTQLLRSTDEDRGNDLVGELRERVSNDGRVMLAVDDRERARRGSL